MAQALPPVGHEVDALSRSLVKLAALVATGAIGTVMRFALAGVPNPFVSAYDGSSSARDGGVVLGELHNRAGHAHGPADVVRAGHGGRTGRPAEARSRHGPKSVSSSRARSTGARQRRRSPGRG